MKKINYMMLSCLFVLLGSCTEEVQQKGEQPAPEGGSDAITRQEVTLNLKNKLVLDREKTKGETIASAEENAISALDVYVFASETENGDYSFMERFAYRNTPDAVLPAGASELQLTPTDADAKVCIRSTNQKAKRFPTGFLSHSKQRTATRLSSRLPTTTATPSPSRRQTNTISTGHSTWQTGRTTVASTISNPTRIREKST